MTRGGGGRPGGCCLAGVELKRTSDPVAAVTGTGVLSSCWGSDRGARVGWKLQTGGRKERARWDEVVSSACAGWVQAEAGWLGRGRVVAGVIKPMLADPRCISASGIS
jgi:hypothetical protein